MKNIIRRATCVALVLSLTLVTTISGIRMPGQDSQTQVAKAAASGKYVRKIVISNKSSKEDAEKELGDEYTVLDNDFGEVAGTHAWIAFATTDDPSQAIRVVTEFGNAYGYNNNNDARYLYFCTAEDAVSSVTEEESTTASVFGNATLLIAGLALIIGVIVGMLSMRIRPKTNQKDEGK